MASPAAVIASYVERHPARSARAAAQLLASPNQVEREQGERFAAALRAADRCRECGRGLSDPDSVERGIGPECLAKGAGG